MGNDTVIFTIFFIIMLCNLLLFVSLILLGRSGNAYPEETVERVRRFIRTVPTQCSHHGRKDAPLQHYMDQHLTIRGLYVAYLDWVLALYPDEVDRPVREKKFRDIFNTDFNIKSKLVNTIFKIFYLIDYENTNIYNHNYTELRNFIIVCY